MRFYADLHLHGKYARATSTDLDIPNLVKWGKIKGLNLLGTGDFTHPHWVKHVLEHTRETEDGILLSEGGQMRFIWQSEFSFAYTQGGKGRRNHLVVLAPNHDAVKKITERLGKRFRLDYDGRPIFGMSCPAFVEMMHDIDERIEVIPAHAWTPWFSTFGSKSGFDTLKEAFLDQTKRIHAIETGISSDPAMNWRLSQLDGITLMSNSDAHSYWPWRLGRECNVVEMKHATYDALIAAIRSRTGFLETIEVDPNYGKYHFDGHRDCKVCLEPAKTKSLRGKCPKCGKQLTVGVLSRVEELADRPEGFKPKDAVPFRSLLPLHELISYKKAAGVASKGVWKEFNHLIDAFGSEFTVLMDAPEADLKKASPAYADLIIKNRLGKLRCSPGYDGQYGTIIA